MAVSMRLRTLTYDRNGPEDTYQGGAPGHPEAVSETRGSVLKFQFACTGRDKHAA